MIAITMITTGRPGWIRPLKQPLAPEQAAARPRPSSRIGNASTTSVRRESTESIQPR